MPRSSWPAAAHPVRRRVRRGRRLPRPSRPASVPSPLASSTTAWPRCRPANRSSSPTCPGGSCSTTSRTSSSWTSTARMSSKVAADPGPEFDGAWSPDGEWVVYRDSTRGINEDDEIFVAAADGSERRNITERSGQRLGPGLVARRIDDRLQLGPRRRPAARVPRRSGWLEPPPRSTSTPGSSTRRSRRTARRSCSWATTAGDYEIYVADIATGETRAADRQPGRATAGRSGRPMARRSPSPRNGTTVGSCRRIRSAGGPASPTTSTATSGS